MKEYAVGSPEHREAIRIGLCCSGRNCTATFVELHSQPVLCNTCFERGIWKGSATAIRAWFEEETPP